MDLMAWGFLGMGALGFFFGRYVYPRQRKSDFPPSRVVEVRRDISSTF